MTNKILIISLVFLLLSGCWDQRLLKDSTIVLSLGFDYTENGYLQATVSSPLFVSGKQEKPFEISAIGATPRQVRKELDLIIGERIDPSKVRVMVLGLDVAKQPIYPILDVFYRDPRNSLASKLVVVNDTAKNALKIPIQLGQRPSEYLIDLINSGEETSIVPVLNLQTICPLMFDPGQDFALPYMTLHEKEIKLSGLAMFHKESFTGILDSKESLLLLLMDNDMGKEATMTQKLSDDHKHKIKNYITFDVKNSRSKMDIIPTSNHEVNVSIDLTLKIEVIDYPHDQLTTKEEVKKINDILSVLLTEEAVSVIDKIQEANCDFLGIGRKLMAFHPKTWENLNWEKDYGNINIEPKVSVEVIQHGIIN